MPLCPPGQWGVSLLSACVFVMCVCGVCSGCVFVECVWGVCFGGGSIGVCVCGVYCRVWGVLGVCVLGCVFWGCIGGVSVWG